MEDTGRNNAQVGLSNDYENVAMLKSPPESNVSNDTYTASPDTSTSTSNTLPSATPTRYQEDPIYGNVDTDAPVSKPIKVSELMGYVQRNNGDGSFATEYEVYKI